MDGVLAIDKPAGMTSHDVVARVRKALGTRKVGHGGTLDPDATGVLLVGVGKATRFLSYAQAAPKRYRAEALFGVATSTQDASGEVVTESDCAFAEDDLRRVMADLTGTIEQVPPMVSAIKIDGERLYRKARRGESVDVPPRSVVVHELELLGFQGGPRPTATFEVRCSGGTYVRTLAHDMGAALGCGAHLTSLRRIEANGFSEPDLIPLEEVTADALRPLLDAVRDLARLDVDDDAAVAIAHGRRLPADDKIDEGVPVALVGDGRLLAVYRRENDAMVADRVVPS